MLNHESLSAEPAPQPFPTREQSGYFPTPKTYYIKTFGCQMNVADSEKMASLLSLQGLTAHPTPEGSDIIIINGCTVREKAVHKAMSLIGAVHNDLVKRGLKKPIIGMAGCVAQNDKQQLFARAPYLDFVFGPDAIDFLPEILFRVKNGERKIIYTDFDQKDVFHTETKLLGNRVQAFVNIMKGCDKYCTYCIVPFTRGNEKSRPIDEVLEDLANLAKQGVREVTLLGQNVNSFGKGNPNHKNRAPLTLQNQIGKVGPDAGEENFPQLLRAMDQDPRLEKIKRVRFTSSHPLDFSDELIDCYRASEQGGVGKLTQQLHLPVQSGSDRILAKMGRKHKIQSYIDQMMELKKIRPGIGLSSDIIVGFPTETEEDFKQTLKLLEIIQYDQVYAFAYSPRPGTRAFKLEDNVPKEIKNRRLNELLQFQNEIAMQRNQKKVGAVEEVLVESLAKQQKMLGTPGELASTNDKSRVWTGRTSCNRIVNFADDSSRPLTGQFLKVKITSATSLSLRGELLHDPMEAEMDLHDSLTYSVSPLHSSEVH